MSINKLDSKDSVKKHFGDSNFHRSIEDLYKNRLNALVKFAQGHVYRSDLAIDVVHDAISKSVEYFNRHPGKKVSERIVQFLILKACKKVNKFSIEIPSGLSFGENDNE